MVSDQMLPYLLYSIFDLARNFVTNLPRIYLDVCCFNRPLDNWQQDRVRIEREAVVSILDRVRGGKWTLVSSEAVEAELERLPNPDKLANVMNLLSLASENVAIDNNVDKRAQSIEQLGFGLYDALHIACAEKSQVNVLLTTDDRLRKRALRYKQQIQVQINNPVDWLMVALKEESQNDTD